MDQVENLADNFVDFDITCFFCCAQLHLDEAFTDFLADSQPDRGSDQIHVLKLDAWTFVTIIEHDLNSGRLQLGVQLFSRGHLLFILFGDDDNRYWIWGNVDRPA